MAIELIRKSVSPGEGGEFSADSTYFKIDTSLGSNITTANLIGAAIGRSGGIRFQSSDASIDFGIYGATSSSATNPFFIGTFTNHGFQFLTNAAQVGSVSSTGVWALGPQVVSSADITHVISASAAGGSATGQVTLRLQSATAGNEVRLDFARGAARKWQLGVNSTDGIGFYSDTTNSVSFGISSAGLVTIGPPAGGVANLIYGSVQVGHGTAGIAGVRFAVNPLNIGSGLNYGFDRLGDCLITYNHTNNDAEWAFINTSSVTTAGLRAFSWLKSTSATVRAELGHVQNNGLWTFGPQGGTGTHHVHGSIRLATGGGALTARYVNTDDTFSSSFSWRTMQLGNNGTNIIAAGRTVAGGSFEFYTNVTNDNDGGNWTPNGIKAMTISSTGATTIGNGSAVLNGVLLVNNGAATNGISLMLLQRVGVNISNFQFISANSSLNITNATVAAPSDVRLKEDFQSFDGLAMVDGTQVFDFKWKADASRSLGFKAQELHPALAYALTEGDADPDTIVTPWGINYAGLVPVLWRAVQQLKARIETLENA